MSAMHWELALHTGLVTGLLALVLSFTPLVWLYRDRLGNAVVMGVLTSIGDTFAHPNHYGFAHAEALLTGVISGGLAYLGAMVLESLAPVFQRVSARVFRRRMP